MMKLIVRPLFDSAKRSVTGWELFDGGKVFLLQRSENFITKKHDPIFARISMKGLSLFALERVVQRRDS